ncbi:hypothetical protein [Dasineura jujubifolia toursvirus 2a]|nr:hypothetical protein [Dasineura jujubifolia toursvirus 2a]
MSKCNCNSDNFISESQISTDITNTLKLFNHNNNETSHDFQLYFIIAIGLLILYLIIKKINSSGVNKNSVSNQSPNWLL